MGKSTASIVVALIVGATIGFALGRMGTTASSDTDKPTVADAAKPSEPSRPSPSRPAAGGSQVMKATIEPNQPQKGPADAKVTIIAVSDFQCPFCSRVNPTIEKIREEYAKDVRIVWGNNPLSFHKDAMPAAEAALAAHEQGKFWEYHDKLFSDIKALTPENFERYAKELGLDVAKWKASFESGKHKTQILAEQKRYGALGARGTPAFFINGQFFSGAQPFEAFKAVIDEQMKRADAELAKGTKKAELYAALIKDGATTPPANPRDREDDTPKGPVYVEVPADSPAFGPKDAKVTIVAFSDFECPFCSRVNPTLAKIKETYGKDVRVVFRHLPLPFHKQAQIAAEASMAAHEQGKFWEYHDKLFQNQRALQREDLEKYAQEVGLDVGKFKAALDSGKFADRVKKDAQYAGTVGARGTPMFFINGKTLSGAQPFENFKKLIDEEQSRADAALKSGTPKDKLYEKLTGKSS